MAPRSAIELLADWLEYYKSKSLISPDALIIETEDELAKPVLPPKIGHDFLIGQRVILNNRVIGTVCKPEHENYTSKEVWVMNPERGYASAYAIHNVKPLPNGQL